MEAPESVVLGLRSIRPNFRLVWNQKGRVIGERSFDVNGNPREVTWDPRWELWDTDVDGVPYLLMRLEDPVTHAFMPPGQWLLDLLNLIDPAKYEGDMERLMKALVDDPNEHVKRVNEQDFERLIDTLSNYFTPAKGRGMVTV